MVSGDKKSKPLRVDMSEVDRASGSRDAGPEPSADGETSLGGLDKPSKPLRLDPNEEKSPFSKAVSKKPSPPPSSAEDETYLPVPSVESTAAEFASGAGDVPEFSHATHDRYSLIKVLGKGGFGVVYLAHDSVLDQDVAIKVLKLGAAEQIYRKRFIFEARTAARLRHSAIVNVFDIIQTDGGLQIIMEYYPGGTLHDKIKQEGKIEPKEALRYLLQVARGLAYAHRKKIIHRDIKPANIFFADDDTVKLGDFGICARYEGHDHTVTGEIIGTPLYMAPEQAENAKDVDPRSDIYSLGLTLYHMITGRAPRVVKLDGLPKPIRPLVEKATAHDRHERPVSCEQYCSMIEKALLEWEGVPASQSRDTRPAPDLPLESSVASTAPSPDSSDAGGDGRSLPPISSVDASDAADQGEATATQIGGPLGGPRAKAPPAEVPRRSSFPALAVAGVLIAVVVGGGAMLMRRGGGEDSGTGATVAAASATAPIRSGDAVASAADFPVLESGVAAAAALTNSSPGATASGDQSQGVGAPVGESDVSALVPAPGDAEIDAPGQTEGGPEEAAPSVPPGAETDSGDPAQPGIAIAAPTQIRWSTDSTQDWISGFLDQKASENSATDPRKIITMIGEWLVEENPTMKSINERTVRTKIVNAAKADPANSLFPYLLGRFYEVTGNSAASRRSYARAHELYPPMIEDPSRIMRELIDALDFTPGADPLKVFLFDPPKAELLP